VSGECSSEDSECLLSSQLSEIFDDTGNDELFDEDDVTSSQLAAAAAEAGTLLSLVGAH